MQPTVHVRERERERGHPKKGVKSNLSLHRLSIVESIPENLTYPSSAPSHLSTYRAWMNLLSAATESVDIASYYWTLRGTDSIKDVTDKQVHLIING